MRSRQQCLLRFLSILLYYSLNMTGTTKNNWLPSFIDGSQRGNITDSFCYIYKSLLNSNDSFLFFHYWFQSYILVFLKTNKIFYFYLLDWIEYLIKKKSKNQKQTKLALIESHLHLLAHLIWNQIIKLVYSLLHTLRAPINVL